jgi:hypothetical protein
VLVAAGDGPALAGAHLDASSTYGHTKATADLMERFDPSNTCQVLLAAGKHAGRPLLYADSGIENVNGAVDSVLPTACLDRILAQVEVASSNSLVEAYWRSLKHQ